MTSVIRGILLSVSFALGGFLAGQASAAELPTFRFATGTTPLFVGIPVGIAYEKGFFEEAGIKVALTEVPNLSNQMALLMKGEVDANDEAGIGLVCPPRDGRPCIIVGAIVDIYASYLVINTKHIRPHPTGLKGQEVGVLQCGGGDRYGGLPEGTLKDWVGRVAPGLPIYCGPRKDHTGKAEGIYMVPVGGGGGSTARVGAMLSGHIHATLLSAPTHLKLVQPGSEFAVLAGPNDIARVPTLLLVVTKDYFAKKGDMVCKFMKGIQLAAKWYAENQTEATGFVKRRLKVSDSEAAELYKLGLTSFSKTGKVSKAELDALNSLYTGNAGNPYSVDFSRVPTPGGKC